MMRVGLFRETDSKHDSEQEELLEIIDKLPENIPKGVGEGRRGWNAFIGDYCCRVVREFLERYTDKKYEVVGPHVYIKRIPTEFDLLIIEPAVTPKRYTNAYPSAKVHGVIEVKMRGPFYKKKVVNGGNSEFEKKLEDISKNFERPKGKNPNIKCAYIAIETRTPKKGESINYYRISKNKLEEKGHRFFALRNSDGSKEPYRGEWSEFLNYILE